MPYSYAQTSEVTCPACGKAFSTDVWLIVDAGERPDLIERLRTDTLHTLTCPHCGRTASLDAPILLFFPDAPLRMGADIEAHLIFSPPQQTSADEDRQIAQALLTHLRQVADANWQPVWETRFQTIPRPLLAAVLRGSMEAVQEEMRQQAALNLPPIPTELQADLRRAEEYEHRYLQTGDLTALRQAITTWETILEQPSLQRADERFQLAAWNDTAITFLRHYEATGHLPDLERAIALWQQAIAITPENSPDWVGWQNNLGGALLRRYEALGQVADLDAAIAAFHHALSVARAGSPDWAGYQSNLGNALSTRYEALGQMADLDTAIAAFHHALSVTRAGSPDWAIMQNNLGNALQTRFAALGQVADLDAAIAAFHHALSVARAGSPDWAGYQNNLGNALSTRYEALGQVADLDTAIAAFHHALSVARTGSPDWAQWQNNLGNALRTRFEALGQVADLDAAIVAFHHVLSVARQGSPDWAHVQANLGVALRTRFDALGQVADLDEAIVAFHHALSVARTGSPDWARWQNNLGNALRTRYEALGQVADLDAAIAAFNHALSVACQGSPNWAIRQANLGVALRTRFDALGQVADLDAAITAFLQALSVARQGSPDWARWQANLGNALRTRYEALGQVADLDAAITAFLQALSVARQGSPDWARWQANLGNALRTRYEALGQVADLDAAITAFHHALGVAREGSPGWAGVQANLGGTLLRRYEALGQVADLDAAIAAYQHALSVACTGSPAWARWQGDLGNALRIRYEALGQVADLDAAIAAYHHALNVARAGSPAWARRQTNLGIALRTRYEALGQVADLDAAIAAFHLALSVARAGSPDWVSMQANLGGALLRRYEALGQVTDLDAAIAAFHLALETFAPETFPDDTLKVALPLGRLLMRRCGKDDIPRMITAYEQAVRAWQYLYFEALHETRKQRQLRRVQEMWSYYAYSLSSSGQVGRAVEVLELGRTRQLTEALRARQAVEMLQSPDLKHAWQEVKVAEARLREANEQDYPQREQELADRRRVWYDRLREHFPDYFAAPGFDQIAAVARHIPLTYLLATPAGGLALIVYDGTVSQVDLPGLTDERLNRWLAWPDESGKRVTDGYLPAQLGFGSMSAALECLLPELGDYVMGPVATALRTLTPPSAANATAAPIVLIPTGRLTLLPLHAARYTVDGRETWVLDEFTVTYAPSALALAAARRALAQRQTTPLRLVGVGNPLPSVAALAELHRQIRDAVAALPPSDQEAVATIQQQLTNLVAQPTATLRYEWIELHDLVHSLPQTLGEPLTHLHTLVARWPRSLPFAKPELQSVVNLVPPEAATPLYEEEATYAALLPLLHGATHLHFSCHGTFNPDEPLDSALLLAGDDRLRLRDLLAADVGGLDAARLAVLSACQTAISDFQHLPEELIGLPTGLLQAGVPTVIGTLWSVDDAGTALLITRTYELMFQDGQPPAQALRRAQQWLRDLTNAELEAYLTHHQTLAKAHDRWTQRMHFPDDPSAKPFADPSSWAPFVCYGAGEVAV
ncbi:MAG: CHAT domain-containing protein [Chloroflexus sp.]|uniref:CHAT domain-containing protein n=1 Tax=Chloroflexus sp. TaxID=1904827 RepID=UPI0030A4C8C1